MGFLTSVIFPYIILAVIVYGVGSYLLKIWNACDDISEICKMMEEKHHKENQAEKV